ncbi:hypothetical protein [Streptomyces iconiensis]|uniref:Uncharacterized protein n=1 Tax=Streptomyces iconiensis TaxID=1384038 RepID=A0ABT7A698_9ACTN|nr:hypothetical protein [Streptomyces iconiensis]MDJ1136868.1 hypothetical protein [Streptomyces iconiensis]
MFVPRCACSPYPGTAHGNSTRWTITVVIIVIIAVGVLAQAGLSAEWLAAIAAVVGTARGHQQP